MVIPVSCYAQLQHQVVTKECLQVVVVKTLGYAVVCLAPVAKVPQIVNVIKGGVQGLSFTSLFVESVGYTLMVGYN